MQYLGILIVVPLYAFFIEVARRWIARRFGLDATPNPLTQVFVLILAALATILTMIILKKYFS